MIPLAIVLLLAGVLLWIMAVNNNWVQVLGSLTSVKQ